jgi:predicted alpha/beta hydrolase family esterase
VGNSRIELLPDRVNLFGDGVELETMLGLSGHLVTVFIHGYNVKPGALGVEYASGKTISEWDDFWILSGSDTMSMDTKENELEVNIIAHSLGNGFLLKALQVLDTDYPGVMIDHVFMWDAAVPNNVFNRPKPKNNTYDRWDFKNTLNAMQKLTVLHSYNDNVLGPFAKGDQQKAKIEDVYKAKPANEWLDAYICDLFQLESLYLIAMGLEIDTGVLLTLNGQEKGYQHLLSFHPDLISQSDTIDQMRSDFKNGYYMPTLDQHMSQVYSSNHYSALTHQVEQGFKKLLEDIHEPSSGLNQYLLLHPDTKESIQPILDNIDTMNANFNAMDVDFAKNDGNDYSLRAHEVTLESEAIIYEAHEMGGGGSDFSLLGSAIALLHTSEGRHKIMRAMYLVNMLTDKRINERFVPAMGYAPLDKPPSYFKGKVNYVNQTQWLFEHSGMRIPSKDLMTNIIKPKIKDAMQHFGQYPKLSE